MMELFYRRYPNAPRPNGRPMTQGERDAWLEENPEPPVFPEYRVVFAILEGHLVYKLLARQNANGAIEDARLHDCFLGCLDGLFKKNNIYGRPVDRLTLEVIVTLLREDITLPRERVLNTQSVLNTLRDVMVMTPSRNDWRGYRYLEDAMPVLEH